MSPKDWSLEGLTSNAQTRNPRNSHLRFHIAENYKDIDLFQDQIMICHT